MTLGEWLEAAVAVGTGALAFETWRLAKGGKEQVNATMELGKETARLAAASEAEVATLERHYIANNTPVLDIAPEVQWAQKEADQDLMVVVRNLGTIPGTLIRATVTPDNGAGFDLRIPDPILPASPGHLHLTGNILGRARPETMRVELLAQGRDRSTQTTIRYLLRWTAANNYAVERTEDQSQ